MTNVSDGAAAEAETLRRSMNDLLVLFTLPAMWAGGDLMQITRTLLDTLMAMLDADFLLVRFAESGSGLPVEVSRTANAMQGVAFPDIWAALTAALGALPASWPAQSEIALGDVPLLVTSLRIGVEGNEGVLVAGSRRLDFPSQSERLLITVAANQAAIALKDARTLSEQRRLTAELDARVSQRTAELAAMNEALRIEIAERLRGEAALRDSERNARLVVDSISALVAISTPSGEVEGVNNQFVDYAGVTLEDIRRWSTSDLIHHDDRQCMAERFTKAIASGEPYDFEARIRRFDGVYRWFQIRGLPFRDADGTILRWYTLNTDIDDRKRAEEARDQLRSELARVTGVMSLGEMAASIAHEVNQPLAGIITNASTCLRMLAADPPNVQGALETARRTIRDGNRAADVVARLRALFKKRSAVIEPIDLNDAAREVVTLLGNDMRRGKIDLRVDFASNLPLVGGDRVQLQQVIMNLLRNAAEALAGSDDHQRHVTISTQVQDDGNIRLFVEDSGPGLGEMERERIFNAFYSTKTDGMGIGLSVSRSIIEGHKGRLWATANEGPGATFAFSIPPYTETGSGAEFRLLASSNLLQRAGR